MVLRQAPPAELTARPAVARTVHKMVYVVEEGARLQVGLPAYLTQRRVLLNERCLLIAPLRDLVHGYEEPSARMPTTTEDFWATGLGAAPWCA